MRSCYLGNVGLPAQNGNTSIGAAPQVLDRYLRTLPLARLEWPYAQPGNDVRDFTLFVAADYSKLEPQIISRFFRRAFSRGAVFACLWGPGCESAGEIARLRAALYETAQATEDFLRVSTHAGEPLEEALFYAVYCGFPTDGLVASCGDVVAAAAGDEAWARRIDLWVSARLSPGP